MMAWPGDGAGQGRFGNITLVLKEPRHPENVGSIARVMKNFGFFSLCLVGTFSGCPEAMRRTATHNALDVLDAMRSVPTLGDAVADCTVTIGTTARTGRQRRPTSRIEEVAAEVWTRLRAERIAIVFGPENTGLSSADLELCSRLVSIPTAGFSSLNLAQAVAIVCYEFHRKAAGGESFGDPPAGPRLASAFEIGRLHAEMKEILHRMDQGTGDKAAGPRFQRLKAILDRRDLRAAEAAEAVHLCRRLQSLLAPLAGGAVIPPPGGEVL